VCCSSCWTWSPLGKRTTCKHCGGPLLFTDGYSVDEVLGIAPTGGPALTPAYAGAAPAGATVGATHAAATDGAASAQPLAGVNWISIARLLTVAYGLVTVLALLAVALLVRQINVPVVDPSTGIVTYQTFDVASVFLVAGVISAALFALFAWLTQFTVARAVLLLLDVLALFGAVTRLGNDMRAGGAWSVIAAVNLVVGLAYGGVLLMTFISPPRRASN
jgi:hypothetical protein